MKTLEEVITVLDGCFLKSRKEWCIENCPYLQNNEQTCRQDVLKDALHYLKEYRDKQDEDFRQAYIAVRNEMLFGSEDINEPLSWQELQQMEGKPVWVEVKYNFDNLWHGHWEVIQSAWDYEYEYDPYLCMTNDMYRHKDEMDKYWRAYRKERS